MVTKKPASKTKKPVPAKKVPVKAPTPVKKAPSKVRVEVPVKKKVKAEVTVDIPTHPPELEEELPKDAELPEPPTEVPDAPEVPDEPGTELPELPKEPEVPKEPIFDREGVIAFIESLIDTLTFKRVALIALMTIIGLVIFSLYENRNNIVERVTTTKPPPSVELSNAWVLSNLNKVGLQSLAKTTGITLVLVSEVDLRKNTQKIKYTYLDDTTIVLEPELTQAFTLPYPLFDLDPKNTAQMVAVLNNEFRCDAFTDTYFFRITPSLGLKLPQVCRMAIPPFAGQFVGFVNIFLNRSMTRQEL